MATIEQLIEQENWTAIRKTEEYKLLTKNRWMANWYKRDGGMDRYFQNEIRLPKSLQGVNYHSYGENFTDDVLNWIEETLSNKGFERKDLKNGRETTFRKKGHDIYYRVKTSTIRNAWNYGGKQLCISSIQTKMDRYKNRYGEWRTTKTLDYIYIEKDILGHQGMLFGDFYTKVERIQRLLAQ